MFAHFFYIAKTLCPRIVKNYIMKNISTQQKIFFGFIFTFTCIGFFSWITYSNMKQTVAESNDVNSSLKILKPVENVFQDAQHLEISYNNYAATGKENFLEPFNYSLQNSGKNLDELLVASQKDSQKFSDATALQKLLNEQIQYGKHLVKLRHDKGMKAAIQLMSGEEGKKLMHGIYNLVNKIEERERAVLNAENVAKKERAGKTLSLFVILSLIVFVFLLISFGVIRNDFLKRKKHEARINYLAMLVSNIHDAIFSTDTNFVIQTWNKGAEQIYGWSAEEAIGKSVEGLLLTDYGDTSVEKLVDDFRKNGFFSSEVKQKNKAGETLYILVSSSAVLNVSGKQTGAVSVNKNITKRKELENELKKFNENLETQVREKTAELKNIFERVTDAFIALDKNWCYTYVNKKAGEMNDRKPEDLIGKNIWEEFPEIIKEPFYETMHYAMENQASVQRQIYDSSTDRWYEDFIYPSADGISVYYHDITDKKKAEEKLAVSENRFRAIFETEPECVKLLDRDNCIIEMNAAGVKMVEAESAGQVIGQNVLSLVDKKYRDEFQKLNKKIFEGNSGQLEFSITGFKGTNRWMETHGAPLCNQNKEIVSSLFVTRDITDRKKSEEELKRSSSLLQATLESTKDGILVVDNSGKFSGYNGQFIKMWNIPDDILKERDDKKAIVAATELLVDPSYFVERVEALYAHPEEISFDSLELKDGRTIERFSQPQRMNDEIAGRVWSFRDVTEQKKAEEETKKIADQLSEVSSSLPGAVYQFQLNTEGKMSFAYVSEGIYELTGFTKNEVYADAMIVFSLVDEAFLPGMFQSIEISAATIQPWFYVFKTKDLAGKNKWIRGNSIPRKLENGDILWNGTLIDITDLKTSEEELKDSELRYRSLVEQASDAIMITDENGNFVDVNSSLCNMLGYTREELLTSNVSKVIDPEQLEKDPIRFDLLLTGQSMLRERKMLHKNGTIIEVEANIKLIADGRLLAIARDITERKKIEHKLHESESGLKEAQRLSHIGSWELDLVHNKLNWSDEVYRIFGLDKNEFNATLESFVDQVHPDEREFVREAYTKSIKEKTIYDIIHRIILKDGSIKYVHERCETYYDEYDHPIRSIGTVQDITERKKAEEAILKSEAKYRSVVENIHESLAIEDIEGRLVYANNEFTKIFGFPQNEVLNLTLKDYTSAAFYNEILERHNNRMKGMLVPEEFVYKGKRKDGTEIWIEARVSSIIENGKLIGTQSLERDITERKKSEAEVIASQERFRTLYEENPLMNFTLDEDGKVLSVNKHGAADLGYHRDELIGSSILGVFNTEDHLTVLNQIKECISNPKKSFSWELRKVTKSGKTIWVAETGTALLDMNGNYMVMIVCENVTERKNAEKELQQINGQLRKLSSHLQSVREEERTNIAREIHDELGQQLTGLKMDASWIKRKIQETSPKIAEKVDGMISLINETVQSVRRIASELRPGILDDLGLISALEWQGKEFQKRTGIRTDFRLPSDEIEIEKNLSTGIFRVYQETLTNVARHANATELKTSFELNGDKIILKIHDNGIGFDETKTKDKNTLGLVGMKERASMLGGKLTIESSKENGTSILLEVPLKISPVKTDLDS